VSSGITALKWKSSPWLSGCKDGNFGMAVRTAGSRQGVQKPLAGGQETGLLGTGVGGGEKAIGWTKKQGKRGGIGLEQDQAAAIWGRCGSRPADHLGDLSKTRGSGKGRGKKRPGKKEKGSTQRGVDRSGPQENGKANRPERSQNHPWGKGRK